MPVYYWRLVATQLALLKHTTMFIRALLEFPHALSKIPALNTTLASVRYLALDFFISRTSCLKVLSYYTALVLFSQVISEEKLKKAYFLLLILEKVLFF